MLKLRPAPSTFEIEHLSLVSANSSAAKIAGFCESVIEALPHRRHAWR